MGLGTALLVIFGVLIISSFILFPSMWKGLHIIGKGISSLFVQDLAKTPEGASAIYAQAIEEYENRYTKVRDILREYSGKLVTTEQKLVKLNTILQEKERQCAALVQAGQIAQAEDLSVEREEILIEIKAAQNTITALKPKVQEAEWAATELQKKIKMAKVKQKEVVSALKLNKETEKMYDDFDVVGSTKDLDRLLRSVEDGHEESNSRAIGAKVIYDNQLSTKTSKATAAANQLQSSNYIEELKKKYNK